MGVYRKHGTNDVRHAILNDDDEVIVQVSSGDISVSIPPSTDFEARGMDVTTSAQLIDTSILANTYYILIQADIDNTEPVYVGKSSVSTSGTYRGTQLSAGQAVTYPVSGSVYVISTDSSQKIIYTLFNGAA